VGEHEPYGGEGGADLLVENEVAAADEAVPRGR